MPKKIKNYFTQLTYSRPHVNISFWPSGSKAASFSLFFISFGTFSGYIFYGFLNFSFFFRCYDLNACDLPVSMSGLHCGRPSWLAPLNFMVEIQLSEPFSTSTMKFTHRNWWIICIQTVSSKNNEKISKSPEIAPNEIEIEKEMPSLNQMVNSILQNGRIVM